MPQAYVIDSRLCQTSCSKNSPNHYVLAYSPRANIVVQRYGPPKVVGLITSLGPDPLDV